NLSDSELIVTLIIIDLVDNKQLVSVSNIEKRSNYKISEINSILYQLHEKKYLQVQANGNSIKVDFTGLFEDNNINHQEYGNMIKIFEEEFGRTLSGTEVETIGVFIRKYSKEDIIYALRQALLSGAKNTNYINKVLFNNNDNDNDKK
ncbi:MAG: DnaD domain protein, partial [Erysipelotrichaceae bacterium]